MDIMNIFLSLASVLLYVFTTYYDHPLDSRPSSIQFVQTAQDIQDVFLYFFLTEFLVRLYAGQARNIDLPGLVVSDISPAAENRWTHLRQALTIIDILTVFPPLLISFSSNIVQIYDESTSKKGITAEINVAGQLGFLRVVCLLRILRVLILLSKDAEGDSDNPVDGSSRVFFHMVKVLLTFGSVMFCFAGLFMTVEQNYRIWFHDALYFTIVTVSSGEARTQMLEASEIRCSGIRRHLTQIYSWQGEDRKVFVRRAFLTLDAEDACDDNDLLRARVCWRSGGVRGQGAEVTGPC
eukprot:763007-Hanusia_phi.AAC.2